MKWDAVVVGAGVAGLTAALRLADSGRRVLVVAKGVGATHLAPGTVDVLGYADARVDDPMRALPEFAAAHPQHPYALLRREQIAAALEWFRARIAPYRYVGDLAHNFLLPTAAGSAKPSALVPETMAAGDLRGNGRVAVVGLRGLKDFFPAYAAANLARSAPVVTRALELDPLDQRGDIGSLGYAAHFESPEFRARFVEQLRRRLLPGERIGLPAVLGRRDPGAIWRELQEQLDAPVFEIPTLPPSVPGMRVFELLRAALRRAGGRLVIGDRAVGAVAASGRVSALAVETAARTVTHEARFFVLATGGFAAGGLELDASGQVRETVFGLPVADAPQRARAFAPAYFDSHPLNRAGIAVDGRLRPVDEAGGPVYENVHAAGATLRGAEPWREKSGDGISLTTGYAAAGAILEAE
jgi:glycerol-3-phosphate dehydrogenase subunit B